MKIEIGKVKGFQDFLPPKSLKRQAVKAVIEKYYRLYGFSPVETPIVEYDELMRTNTLQGEGEDISVSERFKLKDRGGRNLGLRYEFTFQLSRIFSENPNIKMPFRRYQIGPVFRDEPVTSSRFRQFTQCDVDIVGSASVDADVDILLLVSDILKELKIKAEIEVNNRKLLNSIIESVQIRSKKNIMRELDKIDKIGEDAVKANLKKYADTNQIITLFKMLEKDFKFFKNNAFEGTEEVESLISKCKKYGVKVKFNPFMIRGLGYYTGNIFEVRGDKDSIAGGGRYDKTVGSYVGRDIPAVGISFGLERMTELASIKVPAQAKAILISIDEESETIKLAKKLRKSGISCITSSVKITKALEYANSQEIPFAIFIGSKEIESKKYTLKDMASGIEKPLSEKMLVKTLSKNL